MADVAELEKLREQLAAAEAELVKNREEKQLVADELALAQKEKADQVKKKAFLDQTGLTEEEFDDKKATLEGKLGKKVEEMKSRRIAFEKALERCPVLSKEVIGGSMRVQKDIQEKLGRLKSLIDERQKVLVTKVKRMEEEKLCEIQNASSELRAARGKIVDRINNANTLLFDTEVYELFERADDEVKELEQSLTEQVDLSIKTDTEYDLNLEVDDLQSQLCTVLDFKIDGEEEGQDAQPLSEAEGRAKVVAELRDQIRALEKEKKDLVASEDFLEAAAIKIRIDQLVEELELLADGMPSVEDEREQRQRAKLQAEVSENFRNWDAVKYKKTVRDQTVAAQADTGLLQFLF